MNRAEDAVLKKLMRLIQSKNSWGKNELLLLIGDLAVEQISARKPVRVIPKSSITLPRLEDDDLPPF